MDEEASRDRELPVITGFPNLPDKTRPTASGLVSLLGWWTVIQGGVLGIFATSLLAHPNAAILSALAVAPVMVATGWGLRARKEWARQTGVFAQIYAGTMGIVRGFFPGLFHKLEGINLPDDAISRYRWHINTDFLADAAIIALLSTAVVLLLTSRKVRKEFAESE